MCGIIAVLQQRPSRPAPDLDRVLRRLDDAVTRLRAIDLERDLAALTAIADELEALDGELRGPPGAAALLSAPELAGAAAVEVRAAALERILRHLEHSLDCGTVSWSSAELEAGNAVLLRCKDVIWALGRDRPGTARGIADLAAGSLDGSLPGICAFWAIEVALSALDRLEVRGRDSAGIHVLVDGHGLELGDGDVAAELSRRGDRLFTDGSVRAAEGHLSFVYKAAAEIGELGDNTPA
ncbi:MAG: SIS domain-containing protein, partial [Solirubrobacteraceae bacterium]